MAEVNPIKHKPVHGFCSVKAYGQDLNCQLFDPLESLPSSLMYVLCIKILLISFHRSKISPFVVGTNTRGASVTGAIVTSAIQ